MPSFSKAVEKDLKRIRDKEDIKPREGRVRGTAASAWFGCRLDLPDYNENVHRVTSSLIDPFFSSAAADILNDDDKRDDNVVLLYEQRRKANNGVYNMRRQSIGDCFVAGTLVDTPRGAVPIEEVAVGDTVRTGQGKLTTVISQQKRTSVNPIVHIDTIGGLRLSCTADHRVLVYRGSSGGKNGRRIPPHIAQSQGGGVAIQDTTLTAEWVTAGDLRKTDYLLSPNSLQCSQERPADCPVDDFVLGFFLGDGYAPAEGSFSWELSLGKNAPVDVLLSKLRDAGYSPKLSDAGSGRDAKRIRIHNKDLCLWTRKHLYGDSAEKVFPDWAIPSKDFFDGYFAADGHAVSRASEQHLRSLSTTSLACVFNAAAALRYQGYTANISLVTRSKGTFANAKPLYLLKWYVSPTSRKTIIRYAEYCAHPVSKLTFVEGPTIVYDIGVADKHHSFLANGYAVHNCVGQSGANVTDTLNAIMTNQGKSSWEAETAVEVCYAFGRVEVGQGRVGRGDGGIGAWQARANKEFGTLNRKVYGRHDLTKYDASRSRAWGMPGAGVPNELEPTAVKYTTQTIALVRTGAELIAAIRNGFPVMVCSMQGFTQTCDAEGIAHPSGSWAHAMTFVGIDVSPEGKRASRSGRGLVCMDNTWGAWFQGGRRWNNPNSSCWIDIDVAEKRMLSRGDSWAFSQFRGFPPQKIDVGEMFSNILAV